MDEIPFESLNQLFLYLDKSVSDTEYNHIEDFIFDLGKIAFDGSKRNIKFFGAFFSFYQEAMHENQYTSMINSFIGTFTDYVRQKIKEIKRIDLSDEELDTIITIMYSSLSGMGIHFLMEENSQKYLECWKVISKLLNTLVIL